MVLGSSEPPPALNPKSFTFSEWFCFCLKTKSFLPHNAWFLSPHTPNLQRLDYIIISFYIVWERFLQRVHFVFEEFIIAAKKLNIN